MHSYKIKVDANFVDDVGQTLLNWCAAFGTADMVLYLCDKGADPNRGQRSSSLHYAACFGRPEVVRILLRHGANPDLHDEEGRTPLEKARERNDDGHLAVVQLLETPGAFMSTAAASSSSKAAATTAALAKKVAVVSTTPQKTAAAEGESGEPSATLTATQPLSDAHSTTMSSGDGDSNIDVQLATNILQQLMPVFCTIFQVNARGYFLFCWNLRDFSVIDYRNFAFYGDQLQLKRMTTGLALSAHKTAFEEWDLQKIWNYF